MKDFALFMWRTAGIPLLVGIPLGLIVGYAAGTFVGTYLMR